MSLASYHCSTPGSVLLRRRRGAGCRGLGLAAAVAAERPRRRELAELVPDHVLGDEHLRELPAVVNQKRMADEFRHHRAITRPGLQRLVTHAHPIDLGEESFIDVRAFFLRPAHPSSPLHQALPRQTIVGTLIHAARTYRSFRRIMRTGPAATNDRGIGRFAFLARLTTLGQYAGGAARIPTAAGAAFAAAHRVVDRVHGNAAVMRSPPQPARASRLAEADVHVVGVADGADGRPAFGAHAANLAGWQRDLGPFSFAGG